MDFPKEFKYLRICEKGTVGCIEAHSPHEPTYGPIDYCCVASDAQELLDYMDIEYRPRKYKTRYEWDITWPSIRLIRKKERVNA